MIAAGTGKSKNAKSTERIGGRVTREACFCDGEAEREY